MVEAGSGKVVVITSRVSDSSPVDPGSPIQYADDLDIASDGMVYFSDACQVSAARMANGKYDVMGSSIASFYQVGRWAAHQERGGVLPGKDMLRAEGLCGRGEPRFLISVPMRVLCSSREHWVSVWEAECRGWWKVLTRRHIGVSAPSTPRMTAASCCWANQGPTGRLISYDPRSGATHVVASGLYFANGVAVSGDNSFVAVSSTFSNRVFRFWLKGPKATPPSSLSRPAKISP